MTVRDWAWLADRVVIDDRTQCWEWMRSRTASGYGEFSAVSHGRRAHGLAHRLALELRLGRPLGPGMCALHRCDNPPCCNPAHLFEGTRVENNRDRAAKGRSAALKGSRNGSAKLTAEAVAQIRRDLSAGRTGASLAVEHGVTAALISRIKLGRNWT